MEKIKVINIITLITQSVGILFLMIDGTYTMHRAGWGDYQESFFDRISEFHSGKFWGILFLLIYLVTTLLLIIQICSKKVLKNSLVFALLQISVFLIYSSFNSSFDRGILFEFSPGSFYYLLLIIFIVVIILSAVNLYMKKQIKEEPQKPKIAPITTETNTADELKKFKDLLDSEIITQEEFDEKKKQLLGL